MDSRMRWRLVLAGALLASSVGALNFGRLELEIRDESGAPVAGAQVELTSEALLQPQTIATGSGGVARALSLPPGDYRAEVTAPGFRPLLVSTRVQQDRTTRLRQTLERAPVEEEIEVVAPLPVVDVGTPRVSDHLDLEAIRALPVPRDYRGFTQLVAGVNVVPNSDGLEVAYEPASKGGNFYHDRGAGLGSRDNHYYVDGFQITDMGSGGGDLRIPAGAIGEQEVITSGFPAEVSGGAGYVVNLLTRSGGPRHHGELELFARRPELVDSPKADDSRLRTPEEDKWDAALSAGGPVVPRRLWYFASGQRRESSDDVRLSTSAAAAPGTEAFRQRRDALVAKLTWSPTASDLVSGVFLGEDNVASGTRDVNVPTNRYALREDDYATGLLSWERRLGARASASARLGQERLESRTTPEFPDLGPPNTILHPPGTTVPAYLRDLGSSGDDSVTTRRKRQVDLVGSLFVAGFGDHALRAGGSDQKWEEEVSVDFRYGRRLSSLAPALAGLTFAEARDLALLPVSEYDAIFRALTEDPGSPFFAAADANADGTVDAGELAALRFDSTDGNADGINFLRNRTLFAGASNPFQRSRASFAEDEWRRGDWSLLAGVRWEERAYHASDGSAIRRVSPAWYPRAGVAWDVRGDGRHRLSLAWGVYPDVIRSSMIRFAGNLTGSVFADEVFLGGDWFAYRERGATTRRREAGFVPALENEEEEELQLVYGLNLDERWGLVAQLYRREDRNLIEDYDPGLYFGPGSGDLRIDPRTFGYPESGETGVSYFLANLVGGRRVTEGLDLSLTRRPADGWSFAAHYSWKDARGNSNTDAAADLQGDFLTLDPRQPWMWGPLPGTIEHQIKLFGTWTTPWKLELGGLLYWNDGAVFTEATRFRPSSHDILYNYQRPDGTFVPTGQQMHPGYTTVDLRLRYPIELGRVEVDLLLDVYNALDNQDALRIEESHNDPEFTVYREPRLLLAPRRIQIGARLRLGD